MQTEAKQFHTLTLVSPHGRFPLRARVGETVRDCLWRYGVPLSSVFVVQQTEADSPKPVSGMDVIAGTIGADDLFAFTNRNIQVNRIIERSATVRRTDGFSTEWLSSSDSEDPFEGAFVQLTSADVLELAVQSVRSSFEGVASDQLLQGCIVGVSGGGDSNLLINALVGAKVFKRESIVPVMVSGIEDWDRQAEVAEQICEALGMSLTLLSQAEGAKLAGLDSIPAALARFHREFPRTGREFFGTFLLRRVLTALATESSKNFVILGGNREDTLAEALFCVASGSRPLPYPMRQFGSVTIVDPLYLLPKKVVDGAFPKYSIMNYRNRDASEDAGRTHFYYAVNVLQDAIPGFDLTLLEGLQQLASADGLQFDAKIGEYSFGDASERLVDRWRRVIGDRAEDQA